MLLVDYASNLFGESTLGQFPGAKYCLIVDLHAIPFTFLTNYKKQQSNPVTFYGGLRIFSPKKAIQILTSPLNTPRIV